MRDAKDVKIKDEKENKIAKESDINPIPLHRSYGKKKKEGFFARFNNVLASAIALVMITMLAIIFCMGIFMLLIMMGHIGILLFFIGVAVFVWLVLLRVPRKRLKFVARLKRSCKKWGFTFHKERGFFKGLKWNKQGYDFTVDTGKRLWHVRYYTSVKYLTHVIFIDKNTVDVKQNITKSRLKYVLGFNDPKTIRHEYRFDDPLYEAKGRKCVRALIMNPVPHDVFKKDSNGAVIPIGTGEYLYGYTMFSGSGFIQTLKREAEE